MKPPLIKNPIRLVAVICVAITSGYVMWMGLRLVQILSGPEWCGKALQAERISNQNFGGLTACVDLLKIQLNAIARGFIINTAVIALCLLTLIVIVVAGARLEGKFAGGELAINPDAPQAAQAVADSAQTKADDIKDAAA